MRIRLFIDETPDNTDRIFGYPEQKVSLTQRFAEDEFGDLNMAVYTEFELYYGDDMPTWMDNLRQVIKAFEKHYGYKFDLSKLVKKGKLLTEDPDHGDEWA